MKNQITHQPIRVLLVIAAMFFGSAYADQIAIAFDTTQFWSTQGGAGVFGWQFTARSDIQITALGLYDNAGIYGGGFPGDGLVESHAIGIWAVSNPSSPLVSTVIPAGTAASLVSGFRYVSTTPTILAANGNYVVAALFSNIDPKDLEVGAINNPTFALTVNPDIRFGGYRWNNAGVLTFPGNYDPGDQFSFGPNFMFTVPEPSNLVFCALAAVVLFRPGKKVSAVKNRTKTGGSWKWNL